MDVESSDKAERTTWSMVKVGMMTLRRRREAGSSALRLRAATPLRGLVELVELVGKSRPQMWDDAFIFSTNKARVVSTFLGPSFAGPADRCR